MLANELKNLALSISEGGIVEVPLPLKKKIFPIIKTAYIGHLNEIGDSIVNFLKDLPKPAQSKIKNLKSLESLLVRVKKQADFDPSLAKSINRKKTIKVKLVPEDFGKFQHRVIPQFKKGLVLPVKVTMNTKYSPDARAGFGGKVQYMIKNDKPDLGTLSFHVDVSHLAGKLKNLSFLTNPKDILGSLRLPPSADAKSVFMKAVEDDALSDYYFDKLNQTLSSLEKAYSEELSRILSNSEHELVHLVQAVTNSGMSGKFFDPSRSKSDAAKRKIFGQAAYLASDVEYKPWLRSLVDRFYTEIKPDSSWKEFFKYFTKKEKFFMSIKTVKDEKSYQQAIRDFSVAVQKDRRSRPFRKSM